MKKWISGLAAALLIVTMSAGCGKTPAAPESAESSEGGVITLPPVTDTTGTQAPVLDNLNPLTSYMCMQAAVHRLWRR